MLINEEASYIDVVPFVYVEGNWFESDAIKISRVHGVNRVEKVSGQKLKVIFEKLHGNAMKKVLAIIEKEYNLREGRRGHQNVWFNLKGEIIGSR